MKQLQHGSGSRTPNSLYVGISTNKNVIGWLVGVVLQSFSFLPLGNKFNFENPITPKPKVFATHNPALRIKVHFCGY